LVYFAYQNYNRHVLSTNIFASNSRQNLLAKDDVGGQAKRQ